jgi:hypothetical protein
MGADQPELRQCLGQTGGRLWCPQPAREADRERANGLLEKA